MTLHFVQLMSHPERAWTDIRHDEETRAKSHYPYLLLGALLPALCMFIGTRFTGWSLVEAERIRLTTVSALQLSVLIYLTIVAGTFVMAAFLRWMSRPFDVRPTYDQCVGFIAYLCTPFFIAGLGALYPTRWMAITVLLAAGFYATYLLYVGLPVFMKIERRRSFLLASCAWAVGLLVLVNIKVGMILLWVLALGPNYERNILQDQTYPTQEERPATTPPRL